MSTTTKLIVIRGDDTTLNITFKKDGVAFDITGYKVYLTAKRKTSDTDAAAIISKDWTTHVNPTQGVTQIVLSKTDTNKDPGVYVWDLQLKSSLGDVASTVYGQLQIMADITIRTT